jgi:hypothetical protein
MMVRAVLECGLPKAAAARQFNTTPYGRAAANVGASYTPENHTTLTDDQARNLTNA